MKSEHDYSYVLRVEEVGENEWAAYLDDAASPLRGFGDSPLQAIAQLCETLKEWPIGGARRWLTTPEGIDLARKFMPGYEPGKPGSS